MTDPRESDTILQIMRTFDHISKIRRFILAALTLFCACSVGSAEEPPIDTLEQPRLITLSDGIKSVLNDNRLIRIALSESAMGYQDTLLARSALLPQVSVFAGKEFLRYQPMMRSGGSEIKTANKAPSSYGIAVYQTLFDFGKSIFEYRAARKLLQAREENIKVVKRLAVLEFITAYFDLLEAEKMIVVYEQEAEALEAHLNDVEHLFAQGAAVKSDLLPAKIELADVRQKSIAARNDRQIAAARLNTILAFPLRVSIKVADPDLNVPELPSRYAARVTALAQRPEIAFYQEQIAGADLSQRAKSTGNLPVIYADAGYSYEQNDYQVHEDNASIMLGAKMNLYDGGSTQAAVAKERAHQRLLSEQKDKLIDDIGLELEESFFAFQNAREKIAVAATTLEDAEENVRVYRVRYAAGSATTTEMLEAISLQTKAKTNHYRDDYELKRSYAKVLYSMGEDLAAAFMKTEDKAYGDTEPQK
mgnify:CR=1 FL=1